jgi:hypothetical protein
VVTADGLLPELELELELSSDDPELVVSSDEVVVSCDEVVVLSDELVVLPDGAVVPLDEDAVVCVGFEDVVVPIAPS